MVPRDVEERHGELPRAGQVERQLAAQADVDGVAVGTAVNPGDRIDQIHLRWGEAGHVYIFTEHREGTVATDDAEAETGARGLASILGTDAVEVLEDALPFLRRDAETAQDDEIVNQPGSDAQRPPIDVETVGNGLLERLSQQPGHPEGDHDDEDSDGESQKADFRSAELEERNVDGGEALIES